MSDEWKWQIGVDSSQADQAFDSLVQKSSEADGALDRIIESLTRLEEHLANLNKTGSSGLGALAGVAEIVATGLDKISTQLSGVLGRLTRLVTLTEEMATASASSWGQGATAAERYSDRIAGATLRISELRSEAARLSMQPEPFSGGDFTIGELLPDLDAYQDALANLSELEYAAGATRDPSRQAQLLVAAYAETDANVRKYLDTLRQVEKEEAGIVALTDLEAKAREQARAAAQEQAQQMPEHALASFFTERETTPWSEKFGLGDMTGFEQSLLRTLTIFDQLRGTARENQVGFSELIQTLETLASMRFQPLGNSILQIRRRVDESTASTRLLIQELELLRGMEVGVARPTQAPGVDVAPQTSAGYWAEQAGAPYAEIASTISDIGPMINAAFERSHEGAERAAGRIEQILLWLKQRAVGGSIIPDMVRDINMWLEQIGGHGALRGVDEVGQKMLDVQREIQQALLLETGGLPGYEQSDEIIELMLRPYREALEAGLPQIQEVMAQASSEQWQMLRAPTGQMVPVPPEFVMTLGAKELAQSKDQLESLTSSEEELSAAAHRVATSLWDQAKVARTKGDILRDLRRGTISAAQADEELAKMNKQTQSQMEKTSVLANRFMRHITWIFQGMIIWGGVRAFQDMVRNFNEAFTEIETSAAHAAFIVESSTERMMAAQKEYAMAAVQYGAKPGEAAPVLPLAERYGMADPRVAELSAQLALVSDEEMSMADAATYLMSVMRQWNITLDDSNRVLDTLATMYATTPGSMKEFLDLMREGPALAEQMGQSFEENMLLISRAMSFLPGRTATTVSGTMGRLLTRVYRQDAARQLAQQYGISVFDQETLARRPGLEILDDIAQKFREIGSESEKAALAELVAGSRQGQAWRDAYVMLENWSDGIRDAQTELRNFDSLVDEVAGTHGAAVDEMTASWDLLWQAIGQSTGAIQFFDDVSRNLAEGWQESIDVMDVRALLRERGLYYSDVAPKYEAETGREAWVQGARYPTPTEDFRRWVEEYLRRLFEPDGRSARGGRGYASAARGRGLETFGEFRESVLESGASLKTSVEEAATAFNQEVTDTADTVRKTLLTAMIGTGWTPGTGIVDLSEYSMGQINAAMKQSGIDTQRMISAYRQFLQDEGFGAEAIEKAMVEFTNKLMLQMQFFRLPGNQIRLMEGRDLLFYLSQIEENTRPLEGIWNVPEGMRVWVPIESTFYGEWRQRQEEAGEEAQSVTLDASGFNAAVGTFGAHVDTFGAETRQQISPEEFAQVIAETNAAAAVGQWPGISDDMWGMPWPQWNSEEFATATSTFVGAASSFNSLMDMLNAGVAGPLVPDPNVTPVSYGPPAPPDLDIYLPLILRTAESLSAATPDSQVSVDVPEPLRVDISRSQLAQGVAVGTVQTGMPVSMSAMALSMSAMAGAIASQIYYLMLIASNTAQAPTYVVTNGGTTTPTSPGVPTALDNQMTEWYLWHGSGVVPT